MRNPYLLNEPAIVSFSGGRTSGYMLYHILEAYDFTLPSGVKVIFNNTGKERVETLDFVQKCSEQWGVEIVWTEYCYDGRSRGFKVADYNTASRNGEPFEQAIKYYTDFRGEKGSILPNPVSRFCTAELKIRTTQRYLKSIGWLDEYDLIECAIGLRADEPHRVSRLKAHFPKEDPVCPLYHAGVTEPAIMEWWRHQGFDLRLGQYEGNCDLCFLKSRGKIQRILRKNPDLAQWWIDREEETGDLFRRDRGPLKYELKLVSEQGLLDFPCEDDMYECRCTD